MEDIPEHQLFPYQLKGADWLSERKLALLADDMGVGKTAQVIRAADNIFAERILVLCPAVARVNWLREFKRFSYFSRESSTVTGEKHWPTHSGLVICSYDLVTSYHKKHTFDSLKERFDLLVLDEVHYLKSPLAMRANAVFGKRGAIRSSNRCWALSGTPAPNHVGELWLLLYTFGVTKLSHEAFTQRYCEGYFGPRGFVVTGSNDQHTAELKSLLETIMLRRKKADVLKELPPITYEHFFVEAGQVDLDCEAHFIKWVFPMDRRAELQAKLAEEEKLITDLLGRAGADSVGGTAILENIGRSVSTLRMYTGYQKMEALAALVAVELEDGLYDKIVIFAVHQGVIEGLRTRLIRFHPVTLYGLTPPDKRQKNIDRFQNTKACRVFIGNIGACGTAITLTAASHVLFAEFSWVPSENAQAAMRCHRIGQKENVYVRFAVLADSIDERIGAVLKRKTRDLTKVFDQ